MGRDERVCGGGRKDPPVYCGGKVQWQVTVHSGEVPHGKQLGSIRTSLIVLSLHLYNQLFIAKDFTLPVKGTYSRKLPSLLGYIL